MVTQFSRQTGVIGYVREYAVVVLGDVVSVMRGDEEVTREVVSGLSRFIESAKDVRVGWAELPDFEVILVYDRSDACFGYAVNLDWPDGSEWGYAPFCP